MARCGRPEPKWCRGNGATREAKATIHRVLDLHGEVRSWLMANVNESGRLGWHEEGTGALGPAANVALGLHLAPDGSGGWIPYEEF